MHPASNAAEVRENLKDNSGRMTTGGTTATRPNGGKMALLSDDACSALADARREKARDA